MWLKTVRVQNFRSIEDSGEFSIEPVTCLVGKNESGKTALLQALYKLNPAVSSDMAFDPVEEYPRRDKADYDERLANGGKQDNVLTTTWLLDEADQDALAEVLGPISENMQSVTISKGYDNVSYWSMILDPKKVVDHVLKEAGLYDEELVVLQSCSTVGQLATALEDTEDASPRQQALLSTIDRMFTERSALSTAIAVLNKRLPKFLYFANYQRMPGQVSLEDLARRKANDNLEFGHHVFSALLDLAGTSPEQIQEIGRFEQFIAKLEAVSNRISREIFTYWSQNRHLDVDFRLDAGRSSDPAPFNSGSVFRTRIRNNRHRVTVGFDERSAGFVWFFSFLVWFSQLRQNYGDNVIVLLDEPGLSLHAKAQSDLLRYINEKLRPQHQVLYTTHSPFMVDPDNILSARTVEDVFKEDQVLGTKVGDRVLSTDADTLAPLQAALGYDITQSLFVGKHTLLVEGPSDLLYLKWFSRELQKSGRTYLDVRWTISPAGGIDKVNSFVTLFSGNKLHVAVLTDFHEGDKKKIRTLRESEILRQGHVLSAESYAGQDEADIEDLIGRDAYVGLVNKAYGLKRPNTVRSKKPQEASKRVVKEVEDHFALLPPDIPNFDHYSPAAFLVENSTDLRDDLPGLDQALNRFEALFKDLNALLPL